MGFIAPLVAIASIGLGAVGAVEQYQGSKEAAKGQLAAAQGQNLVAQAQANNAAYQSQVAAYQAEVDRNNATISKQNATWTMQSGETEAQTQGMKTRAEVGAMKAAQAANNVDVNSGSAVDVRSSAAELGELNALTIRSNASKQAYGYEQQASNASAESGLQLGAEKQAATQSKEALEEGQQALLAGSIGAQGTEIGGTASLLGNASSIFGTVGKDYSSGMFSWS